MTKKLISNIKYSIVFPVYNEEGNIVPLIKRLEAVMVKITKKYEIVIIDNGSFDSTPKILNNIIHKHSCIVVITLSRNFGYDCAIATALEYTKGEWVILIDGDQQDPPEIIPQFIAKANKGFDIVYGIRAKRTENFLLGFQMKLFYSIWKKIANISVPKNAGNFSIMSRKVINIINSLPERNKFIRGLRAWTGYPSTGIVYQREERKLGKTKFSFLSYLNHALNGITSFSTVPLRVFSVVGFFGVLGCILFGLYVVITRILYLFGYKIVDYSNASGWTTIALLIISAISINLLGLGIIGEYIARILEEVKGRPNSLVLKIERSRN